MKITCAKLVGAPGGQNRDMTFLGAETATRLPSYYDMQQAPRKAEPGDYKHSD